LALSAAASSLAIGGGVEAQVVRRVEKFAPELDDIISTSEPIQELASGTGGPLGPTERPVWWKEGGYLLYSDIHNSRRMKYAPGQGDVVFAERRNRANGLTRDLQGRLLACEHDSRYPTGGGRNSDCQRVASTLAVVAFAEHPPFETGHLYRL
jgi:hypothetical protein